MTRNLKALGLALLAVFALSAVAASAASAANDVFTSSSEKTDLTGESAFPVFTSAGVSVECEKGTYAGTVASEAMAEVPVHPVYEGNCLTAETFPTTVDTHGCDFILTGDTDANGHASAHIACTSGKEITITVFETLAHNSPPLLTIHIPSQTVRGIAYDTIEAGGHNALTVTTTVQEGIESTCTGEFCFLVGGEGALAPASYEDDVTTTGWEDTGNFVRCTDHQWGGSHGEQVDITDSEAELGASEGEAVASVPCFHSEAGETTLIAEDTGSEELSFEAGTVSCAEAGYKGTMSATVATTLTIAPEFASCEAFGFANSEVLFNGCAYVLHRGESAESPEGSLDIECPGGKAIEVLAHVRGLLKCRVTIGSQNGLTTLTETNKGSGSSRDIALDIALSEVSYAQEAGEGLGKCSPGSFENGEFNGSPTMIGENASKEQVGIWAE